MTNLPEPYEHDPLKRTRNAPEGASLMRMAASEQQQPGALRRCPVCGAPYALKAEMAPPPLPESSTSEAASLPSAEAVQRVVLFCPQCGTYSVGEKAGE